MYRYPSIIESINYKVRCANCKQLLRRVVRERYTIPESEMALMNDNKYRDLQTYVKLKVEMEVKNLQATKTVCATCNFKKSRRSRQLGDSNPRAPLCT